MIASRVYLFKESLLVRNSFITPFMLSGRSSVHYLSYRSLELTCFLKIVHSLATSLVQINEASSEAMHYFKS